MKNILIYTSFILYSFFATATLNAVSNHIFLEEKINTYTTISPANDYDLVLTGVVLCESTNFKLSGIVVTLTDLITKEIHSYTTSSDGTYYFILEGDKEYFLSCSPSPIDEKGGKTISTVGKHDEVLVSLLQISACGDDNFKIENESDELTDKNGDNNDMPKLMFKIQIGSFKEQRSEQTKFRRDAGYKIIEEKAPSGFYRYLTEGFYNLEKTEEKLSNLKSKGYDKAFIVSYYSGERLKLSPQEAKAKYGKK